MFIAPFASYVYHVYLGPDLGHGPIAMCQRHFSNSAICVISYLPSTLNFVVLYTDRTMSKCSRFACEFCHGHHVPGGTDFPGAKPATPNCIKAGLTELRVKRVSQILTINEVQGL